MVVLFALLLFISGCGTKETTEQGEWLSTNTDHAKHIVNGTDKNISDSFSPTTTVMNESIENPVEVDSEPTQDSVFLELVDKYNHMFDRIEPDVDYNTFSKEHIGYKFKTIQTKQELYHQFSDFMTTDVARMLWEEYVSEGDEGLYLIPMDGHPTFDKENPYEIEQLGDQIYQLTHQHQSDLYGRFDMVFTFDSFDGDWKITDISFR